MKDEKILKKVGKLLSMYGVSDEEKEKFLLDLKDKKYDDQEEIEEESVDSEEEFEPVENEEQAPVEEDGLMQDEEAAPEQEVPEEQPAPEQPQPEPVPEENPMEAPQEEQPMEQPVPEESNGEEAAKANEALLARIEALEDIISKMGIPLQGGEDVGLTPSNPAGESQVENEYDRFNKMRMGRR